MDVAFLIQKLNFHNLLGFCRKSCFLTRNLLHRRLFVTKSHSLELLLFIANLKVFLCCIIWPMHCFQLTKKFCWNWDLQGPSKWAWWHRWQNAKSNKTMLRFSQSSAVTKPCFYWMSMFCFLHWCDCLAFL